MMVLRRYVERVNVAFKGFQLGPFNRYRGNSSRWIRPDDTIELRICKETVDSRHIRSTFQTLEGIANRLSRARIRTGLAFTR